MFCHSFEPYKNEIMNHTVNPTDPCPRALFIAGPTASGKSAIALAVAKHVNGCIINADSMQVYDTLQVLSARPSAADMAQAPHHLYGHVAAGAAYSVGAWQKHAMAAIAAAHAAGQVPILVGGTGLYFKSLLDGIAEIPQTPDAIRATVRARLQADGAPALHAALAQIDPELASRLPPQDGQRIARGLEVFEATQQKLSVWQQQKTPSPLDFEVAKICLMPDRAWLYARCDRRFSTMLESGGLEEVRALMGLQLAPDSPVMKALGVPELRAYLAEEISLDTAVSQAQQQTRRYAKRQMTWFRNQMVAWEAFNEQDYEHNPNKIFSFISKIGLTSG
jgi:tRNA dimethylallyltransferase